MTNLTNKELAVLTAIDKSEYGDNITDPVWSWSIWDNINREVVPNKASLGGIVASLVEKEYIYSDTDGHKDDRCTGFLDDGLTVYYEAIGGREKMNKWETQADLDRWNAEQEAKNLAKANATPTYQVRFIKFGGGLGMMRLEASCMISAIKLVGTLENDKSIKITEAKLLEV